jgi:hypothetical protein
MRSGACIIATILFIATPLTLRAGAQSETQTAAALKEGGSTYFTTKMENLTNRLNLTPDQQDKLRPVAEQEVGYLEEIRGNAVLSREQKIKKLEEIVHRSDQQMKPFLSADQWEKLQALRKEQKEQLKKYAEAK